MDNVVTEDPESNNSASPLDALMQASEACRVYLRSEVRPFASDALDRLAALVAWFRSHEGGNPRNPFDSDEALRWLRSTNTSRGRNVPLGGVLHDDSAARRIYAASETFELRNEVAASLRKLALIYQLDNRFDAAHVMMFLHEFLVLENPPSDGGEKEKGRQGKAEQERWEALTKSIPGARHPKVPTMPPRRASFPMALKHYPKGGKALLIDRMMEAARAGVRFAQRNSSDPADAAVVSVIAEATLALCLLGTPLQDARSKARKALEGTAFPSIGEGGVRGGNKLELAAAKVVRETLLAMGLEGVDGLTTTIRRRRSEGDSDGGRDK